MLLPVLAVVTVLCVWMLSLASAQLRLVDGTREVARMIARGEEQSTALAVGSGVAPAGTRFTIEEGSDQVTVSATVRTSAPLGLGHFHPSTMLSAESVAVWEW